MGQGHIYQDLVLERGTLQHGKIMCRPNNSILGITALHCIATVHGSNCTVLRKTFCVQLQMNNILHSFIGNYTVNAVLAPEAGFRDISASRFLSYSFRLHFFQFTFCFYVGTEDALS